MIHVSLYSTLRKYQENNTPSRPIRIEYTPGMTIRNILHHLNIREDQEVMLVTINGNLKGQNCSLDLKDGDRVALYGVVDGG